MRYTAPTAVARKDFRQGLKRHAYRTLGAHRCAENGLWRFALWAPGAKQVSLVGEFNGWDRARHPLRKENDGIWSICLAAGELGMPEAQDPTYKYAIWGFDDVWRLKTDPCAFQLRHDGSACACSLEGYAWDDCEWLRQRAVFRPSARPVNIYEAHIGTWRRRGNGQTLSYLEFAEQIVPYLLEMEYTHIELLPAMERPPEPAWGCQTTGFYAVDAGYGAPQQLMTLIDRCHQVGIGVLLDWSPAGFSAEETGLSDLDGTPLYGKADSQGRLRFDLSRAAVREFLASSACFWLEEYHADGLCIHGMDQLLRSDPESERGISNGFGHSVDPDSLAFARELTETLHRDDPGVMLIAGEAAAVPAATAPVALGGLGFDLQWDELWTEDVLSYINTEPFYRRYHHDQLVCALRRAPGQNGVLPLSHTAVTARSLLNQNPGDQWQRFAGLRALYGYAMAHPGRKLLFMGGEFAHFPAWNADEPLDWFLLLLERYPQAQRCVKALNRLYRDTPALYETDDFAWSDRRDIDNSVIAFVRRDRAGRELLCVANFTPVFHPMYRVGLPHDGTLCELFNTDRAEYGGSDQYNAYELTAQPGDFNGYPYWAELCVPPLSCVYFAYQRTEPPFARGVNARNAQAERYQKEGFTMKTSATSLQDKAKAARAKAKESAKRSVEPAEKPDAKTLAKGEKIRK